MGRVEKLVLKIIVYTLMGVAGIYLVYKEVKKHNNPYTSLSKREIKYGDSVYLIKEVIDSVYEKDLQNHDKPSP